jgi:hypothetical protein
VSEPNDTALLDFPSEDVPVSELPRVAAAMPAPPVIAAMELSALIAAAKPRTAAAPDRRELPRFATQPDTSRPARQTAAISVALPRPTTRPRTAKTVLGKWLNVARELNAGLARTRITVPRIPRALAAAFAGGVVLGGLSMWLLIPRADANVASATPAGAARTAAVTADVTLTPSPATPPPVATTGTAAPADAPAAARVEATAGADRTEALPPASSPPDFRGSLTVRSQPPGATVFLNGRVVGRTPIVLANQPAGSSVLRVTLDGYDTWTSAVRVVANQENVVTADLRR